MTKPPTVLSAKDNIVSYSISQDYLSELTPKIDLFFLANFNFENLESILTVTTLRNAATA